MSTDTQSNESSDNTLGEEMPMSEEEISVPSVTNNGPNEPVFKKIYPTPEDYKKCDIDIAEFMQTAEKLGLSLLESKSFDDAIDIVMKEDFYNKVNDLSKLLDKYNFKNAQCIIDNEPVENNVTGKNKFCGNKYLSMVDAKKIARLADVVDKYESLIKKFLEKAYTVAHDSQKYCNLDPEVSVKMKMLTSKLGMLLADDDALKKKCLDYKDSLKENICNDSVVKQTFSSKGNYFGWIMVGCIVLLFIIILVMFFKRHGNSENTSAVGEPVSTTE